MLRRTTALLGAGAILDFDFNGLLKPTTPNITAAIIEEKIQGFEGIEKDLIRLVYDRIIKVAKSEYTRLHPYDRQHEPLITFEDLFEVIETLYSYNGTWKHEQYPFSLISALVQSDLDYYSAEYRRAMVAIIKKIFKIVKEYDARFRKEHTEEWYKNFWKSFNGRLDVFTLNYDTTIEYSLEKYNDGFVGFTQDYERFEPETLWNAKEYEPTVNHLHGCILYGDINPEPTEFYYSHRDLYKFYPDVINDAYFSGQWMPRNQVGDSILYCPIITGLKKTDKICYMPHSFYHANFAKKTIENPSLLICGYSFGDLYVNQLLQRHMLIHDTNEKVVIIDKWPDYVNEDNIRLYRYFMDNITGGFREFVSRVTKAGIAPLETFKKFKHVDDYCWESPSKVLRIYTKGFKEAIDNHCEEIMNYLQND